MYFSAATLFSTRAIILSVVSTPTSALIRISSKLSKTSASTAVLPITARVILPKIDSLVFARLSLSVSSFFDEKKSNIPLSLEVGEDRRHV